MTYLDLRGGVLQIERAERDSDYGKVKKPGKAAEQSQNFLQLQRTKKLVFALKECSVSKDLTTGKKLHEVASQSDVANDAFVASALINMYAKCSRIDEARRVFDSIDNPDVVCWNVIILGYADNEQSEISLDLVWRMRREGYEPDARTLVTAVKACGDLAEKEEGSDKLVKVASKQRGKALHMLAWSYGWDSHVYLENTLVDMYAKCGSMEDARAVFDSKKHLDVVCWNACILGYADNGESEIALDLFSRMARGGCPPNERTFVAALKACADFAISEGHGKLSSRSKGKKLHLLALENGFDSCIFVQNTLVDMYARCGMMAEAHKVFQSIKDRDLVCWNALILGYTDNGESETALELLSGLRGEGLVPDSRTFVAGLKACADLAMKEDGKEESGKNVKIITMAKGKKLHLLVLEKACASDRYVEVTLLDMYAKCGSMENACVVFNSMKHPNVVCWNALILGYADNGEGGVALDVFWRMKRERCPPDSRTFNAVLQACGSIGALEIGKKIHAEICKCGLDEDIVLGNALLDFYVKCGSLTEAERVFDSLASPGLVTWTTLLAGYSCHGDTKAVFDIFDRMVQADITPDHVTFKCILTACNHAGLADMAKVHFEAMSRKFGIKPHIEHLNSMIDVLGRAKQLDEAMVLVRSMPFRPNAVTWTTVLGACRKWKNVWLGNMSFEALRTVDEGNSAAYILMANIYGSKGMWEEQAKIKAMRMNSRIGKKPGRSWWTNEGLVHTFLAGDESHPQSQEIHEKMESLMVRMREEGYVADLSSVTKNIPDVEKLVIVKSWPLLD